MSGNQQWRVQRSDVRIIEGDIGQIGHGSYGEVRLAEYKGELIAAKQLPWPNDNKERERFAREVEPHITLSENGKKKDDSYPMTVPEFKGYFRDATGGVCGILMEKMPFSLDQCMIPSKRPFPLTPLCKLRIMYGIAKCMMYVHLEGVIHRDLKPQNVLLDTNLGVRLCDFGLARTCGDHEVTMTMQIGTPLYEAPETYDNDHYHNYDTKADVFSYGVVVYAMLCRDETWVFDDPGQTKATNCHAIQSLIRDGRRYRRGDIANAYWELITKCWDSNPGNRPTFEEIVESFRTIVKGDSKLARLKLARDFLAGVQHDIDVYKKIKEKKTQGERKSGST